MSRGNQPTVQTCDITDALSCEGVCIQCVDVCLENINESQMNLTVCADSKTFCMRESCLKVFPKVLIKWNSLEVLDLSGNRIPQVGADSFVHMTELRALDLSDNRLMRLEAGTFDSLTKIEEIHLQDNLITEIDVNTFLADLTQLKIIDLSNNLLSIVDTWPLVLPSGKGFTGDISPTVDLSRNLIEEVTNELGITSDSISEDDSVFISLRLNKLKYVAKFNLVEKLGVERWPELLNLRGMIMDIRNNPMHCDCDLYELMDFGKPLSLLFKQRNLGEYLHLACDTPTDLNGWLISYIPKTEFRCNVTEGCPANCTCTHTAYNGTLTVVCPNWPSQCMPDQLPRSANIELYMASNKLISLSDRAYLTNTSVLDLSHNRLAQIDLVAWSKLNNMHRLLLSDNRIESFPANFAGQNFSNLQQLSLRGNPLRCDCASSWLKQWIIDHMVLVDDVLDVVCHGELTALLDMPTYKLCPVNKGIRWYPFLNIFGGGVFLVTLVGVTAFCLWRNFSHCPKLWWHYLLWKNTNRYLRSIGDENSQKFKYNILICLSPSDSDSVKKTLLDRLELEKMSVCIRERDFQAGCTVLENVVSAVGQSQQTIVVLSREFLVCGWSQMEMHMSQMHVSEGKRHETVVVVLDPDVLLNLAISSRSLHDHIVKHGCLYLYQPDFGERLKDELDRTQTRRLYNEKEKWSADHEPQDMNEFSKPMSVDQPLLD